MRSIARNVKTGGHLGLSEKNMGGNLSASHAARKRLQGWLPSPMKPSKIEKAKWASLEKKYKKFHRAFVDEAVARTGAITSEQLIDCRAKFCKKHNIEL